MTIAIVGICALVIGLLAGFALGRERPSKNAAVRRELRDIRANSVGAKVEQPNPYNTPNHGITGTNPYS